jgi:hypothetical protein
MKNSTAKIQKPADVMAEEPFVSFSHLASCFSSNENSDDNQNHTHGFPSSREEILYETGILIKLFMRC